jgi:hypothetical protein
MGGLQSFELIVKEMIADARIRFSVKGRMATLDKRVDCSVNEQAKGGHRSTEKGAFVAVYRVNNFQLCCVFLLPKILKTGRQYARKENYMYIPK